MFLNQKEINLLKAMVLYYIDDVNQSCNDYEINPQIIIKLINSLTIDVQINDTYYDILSEVCKEALGLLPCFDHQDGEPTTLGIVCEDLIDKFDKLDIIRPDTLPFYVKTHISINDKLEIIEDDTGRVIRANRKKIIL